MNMYDSPSTPPFRSPREGASGCGEAAGSICQEDQSRFAQRLQSLDGIIREAELEVTNLEVKLHPILMPTCPDKAECGKQENEIESAMAAALREIARRVMKIRYALENIRGRIDL